MITVYHIKHDITGEARLAVTFPLRNQPPRAETAKNLFTQGGYEKVAVVKSDDLGTAWRATNNIGTSWSMDPIVGVEPVSKGVLHNGKLYGHKSSEVGDIFKNEQTGEYFVVDSVGFVKMDLTDHAPG